MAARAWFLVLALLCCFPTFARADMHASPAAIHLIKESEGLCLKAYRCPADVATIGYGHTSGVKLGDVITIEKAEQLLELDVKACEDALHRLVRVPLTQGQFDALVSWTFNFGESKLAGSTLLRLLNEGDYNGARDQLHLWINVDGKPSKGLILRRASEAHLWDQKVTADFANVTSGSESTAPTRASV